MDALKNLVTWMGDLSGVAVAAATCAAALFILGTLFNPAVGVAVSLAGAGSAVVNSSGPSILCALGICAVAKYLKS